jgi:ribonucleotide monophosphatase NagD (HAD superfamily)
MGVEPFNMAVVGDDLGTDVAGALSCDAAAILVKTGKSQEIDLSRRKPKPDLVLDSIASLPTALGVKFG